MSRMRRLAIVLLTASVVTSAIYATGAFTSLTAERDANIQVAGDAAGYLSIKPASGPNGEYATLRAGTLHISVGGVLGQQSGGVNQNAVTVIHDIFTITNHGSQSVAIWVTDKSVAVTFTGGPQAMRLEGKDHAITLKPGDTLSVGLSVDTRGANADVSKLTAVEIHADSKIAGESIKRRAADSAGGSGSTTKPITRSTPDHEHAKQDSNKQSEQETHKQPTQKSQEQSDDDGGFVGWLKDAGGKVVNTVVEAGEYFYNTFTGFLKHAPGVIINKLRAAAHHSLRAIWSAGETVWNFFVGGALGGFGMPSGWFTAKESKYPSYLIGWMAGTIIPGLDVVTGFRDLVANLINGNTIGAVIEAIGLLPGLGALENVQDLYKVPMKWAKSSPNSMDEAFQMIRGVLLQNLPELAQEKIVKTFVEKPSKAKKILSDLMSPKEMALRLKKKYSLTDLSKKEIATLKNDYGYTGRQMQKLLKQGDFSPDALRAFAKHDINIEKATTLGEWGFSADDVIFLSKHSEDTYPVRVSATGKEDLFKGRVGTGELRTEQLVQLRKQDIPTHHIRYYVKTGVSLKAVSAIEKYVPGASPKTIRRIFEALNKGQFGSNIVGKCRSTRAWIQAYEKKTEAKLDKVDEKVLITWVCE